MCNNNFAEKKLTLNFGKEWVHERGSYPASPLPKFLQPVLKLMNTNAAKFGNGKGW
jgi:hypothetical protein